MDKRPFADRMFDALTELHEATVALEAATDRAFVVHARVAALVAEMVDWADAHRKELAS